jgi:hypothetical protein
MRVCGLILAVALLVGCGAPQITLPMGQAAIFYAQARADYATARVIITQGCSGGRIDKAACDALTVIDTRAQTLRQSVESSLANPSQPVDWAQVMSYAASVSEMLIKLGVLSIK